MARQASALVCCLTAASFFACAMVAAPPDRPDFGDDPPQARPAPRALPGASDLPALGAAPGTPASHPAETPSADPAATALAEKAYRRGLELLDAARLVEARGELSEAYLSGLLDATAQGRALKALEELADKTLLTPAVAEDDPYAFAYKLAPGDVLQRVVRRQGLQVEPAAILRVNRLADASRLRAGETIKLLRGPAHAIVHKTDFSMDLYLQRPGGPKAFVKRIRIAIGKDGSTPEGPWSVRAKTPHAMWTPPPSMAAEHPRPIAWGQAGYPLGKEGYWISLTPTGAENRGQAGYGLHGTNEPDSIGRAASHGCIRLADDDIDLVYSLMAAGQSTVLIRP